MKAQLTLTVAESKAIIALAIAGRQDVRAALATGRILLKGGTTVAAVARLLAGIDLRISGRVSPRGTKAAAGGSTAPHSILIERGKAKNIDDTFAAAVAELRRDDIAVIGANALDSLGRAAMLLGRPLGGNPGQGIAGLMSQGCKVIIACGLEKLIPGPIDQAVRAAGIYAADWALGMATGLVPLVGETVTEQTALETIAGVRCTVIAAGGIAGGEGATTMVIDGSGQAVEAALAAVAAVRGADTSGCPVSLQECEKGAPGCGAHQACAWRKGKGGLPAWRPK
jgi:hypothetical protein